MDFLLAPFWFFIDAIALIFLGVVKGVQSVLYFVFEKNGFVDTWVAMGIYWMAIFITILLFCVGCAVLAKMFGYLSKMYDFMFARNKKMLAKYEEKLMRKELEKAERESKKNADAVEKKKYDDNPTIKIPKAHGTMFQSLK